MEIIQSSRERDFLSTWQAQEHASTLAAEVGASDQVKVDVFTLPKFKPTSINRVRFNDEVTVLIGEDNELGPLLRYHSS